MMKRRAFLAALAAPITACAFDRLDGRRIVTPLNLAFEGDSLTDGSKLSPAGCNLSYSCPDSWPNQLIAALWSADVTSHQFATSGATMRDQIYPRQATVDAVRDPARHNVLFVWAGTNDVVLLGLTAAQIYGQLYQPYIRDRMAQGWTVIPFTIAPRYNIVEGERLAFNGLLKANHHPLLCDVTDDGRIGDSGAFANTDFYVDGTHMTPKAQGIVKDLALMQLQAA